MMSVPDSPKNLGGRGRTIPGLLVGSWLFCIWNIMWIGVHGPFLIARRRAMQEVFNDLEVELPQITIFVLSIRSAVILIGCAVLVIALLAKELLLGGRSVALILNVACLLVLVELGSLFARR